jgi:hypothetical protein
MKTLCRPSGRYFGCQARTTFVTVIGILRREAAPVRQLCAVTHCPLALMLIAQVSIYSMLLYLIVSVVIAATDVLGLGELFLSLCYRSNLNTVSLANCQLFRPHLH